MLKWYFSLFLLLSSLSFGNEGYVINSYDIKININEKNIYTVKEDILVDFLEPRRGIFRVIPSYYNGRKIKLSNIRANETAHIKNEGKYTYIRLGKSGLYLTGNKKYKIEFNQNLGWDKISEYDEVYYNLIGNDWDTTIKKVRFEITLPKSFDKNKINFTSGQRGSKNNNGIIWKVSENKIYGETTKKLGANESLTIALPLEEGYFDTKTTKFIYLLESFALAILYILIILVSFIIYKKNKEEDNVIETVEFYPPDNLTPTQIGYYIDGRIDAKDLTSMIFYWAGKGYLRIEEVKAGNFLKKGSIHLVKISEIVTENNFEKYLFDNIFNYSFEDNRVDINQLSNSFYKHMEKASNIMYIDMIKNDKLLHSRKSKKISKRIQMFIPIVMFTAFLSISYFGIDNIIQVVGNFILAIITVIIITILSNKIKTKTEYGNYIVGKCLGFKRFLTVTEKRKLETLIEENPNYFYDILPYAIVLGVSDTWANKFDGLVKEPPVWYSSRDTTNIFVLSMFMSNFNNSISSLNENMLSSPKSASNYGGGSSSVGGGSSGGGAGGGGGGSW